jgi:hypothetical protein
MGSPFLAGQVAGASAAYCAFFGTQAKNINIRVIQGELMAYKAQLIPFADISRNDSNFVAIEHIAATGLLKGQVRNNQLYFLPDSSITVAEIRGPMREYYTRTQIWQVEKKSEKLTLNDALSLIKFTGNRGAELNREVEKNWKSSFRFKTNFDLNKIVTRRELAVLIDNYLKPFNVKVDQSGKLQY